MDLMRYLGQQRIIFIGDRITDAVANNVVAQLLAMEVADPDAEISIYINSCQPLHWVHACHSRPSSLQLAQRAAGSRCPMHA